MFTDEVRKWSPPIKTEKDALFFLNKVISRRVEQHISFLLRESDPFFSRILNSVNYLIHTQGFVKTNYIGKTYIVETKIFINSKVIGLNEFESLPTELFTEKKKILISIFHHIKSETDFFPAIPLNELILRLKEINLSGFLSNKDGSDNHLKKIEIDEIIRKGLIYTEKKLKETYVSKGKLTEEEHVVFMGVLTDMANDLRDGGLNPGLYEYFKIGRASCRERV